MVFAAFNIFCVLAILTLHNYGQTNGDNCKKQFHLPNGKMTSENGIIKYECYPGFTLQGKDSSVHVGTHLDCDERFCAKAGCKNITTPMGGSITITKQTNIKCDEGFFLFGSNVTYCNGVEWIPELGTCLKITNSCDFEREDMCGWKEHNDQDQLWKWISSDPDFHFNKEVPRRDHTFQSGTKGHFIRMKMDNKLSGVKHFLSPIYPKNLTLGNSLCFQFHIFMFRTDVKDLVVSAKPVSMTIENMLQNFKTNSTKFNLWGHRADKWIKYSIPIDEMDEGFQVVFTVTDPASLHGDIVIDDVKLMKGECRHNSVNKTTKSTKQPTTTKKTIESSVPSMTTYKTTEPTKPPTNTNRTIESSVPPMTTYKTTEPTKPPTNTNRTIESSVPPMTTYKTTEPTKPPTNTNRTIESSVPPMTTYKITEPTKPPTNSNRTIESSVPPMTTYKTTEPTKPPTNSNRTIESSVPPMTTYKTTEPTKPPTNSNRTIESSVPPMTTYKTTEPTKPPTNTNRTIESSVPPMTTYKTTEPTKPPTNTNRTIESSVPPMTTYKTTEPTKPPSKKPIRSFVPSTPTNKTTESSKPPTITKNIEPSETLKNTNKTTEPLTPPTYTYETNESSEPPTTTTEITEVTEYSEAQNSTEQSTPNSGEKVSSEVRKYTIVFFILAVFGRT
ncbi:zonadhesin-like [Drosophila subpulchrella]|uniref:zonadhesin-like n=1 Tax=Drosophila subpulchrella TaxID=1486046 RepID=UPI0018A16E15|nr:zonadhesin-like [Drosophila subpulchrella]